MSGNSRFNREIIVEHGSLFATTIINHAVPLALHTILTSAGIKVVLANRTCRNSFRLTITPQTTAFKVEASYDSIAFVLRPLKLNVNQILTNSVWSKFAIHGITTNITAPEEAWGRKESYPQLTICQAPRWLSLSDAQTIKTHFFMILAFSEN